MTYEKILYSVTDNVACITLNDPATLNALSQTMGRELQDALNRGAQEARAILLTGAGKAFSSGANLTSQDFDMADPQRDVGALLEATFNAITLKLKSSPVPVVSAVRGAAAGIGCAYALAADIIIASENAYFLQAFCNVGLVPDGGATWLLAHAAGRARAMEMMLLGERIPARQAHDWGLINRVVADDALEDSAMAMACKLATGPYALGLIRGLAWAAAESSIEASLLAERQAQCRAGRSEDFLEGVAAFLQKRPASFKGK